MGGIVNNELEIVHQNLHSTNSIQQSLVQNSETTNNQQRFIHSKMQYIYENNTNESLSSQRDNVLKFNLYFIDVLNHKCYLELYNQSAHIHRHPLHNHFQYQHEVQSFSPQQSSTSEIDETSPQPLPSSSSSLNRPNDTVTNKTIKKKKQTKKKRKDPNEPQKPVSPYALFFRDTQNDIKKKLANPSFGEISKVVAHMWESIEPELKEQYKSKAASAKKEYLKQLAAYRAVQVSNQTPNMHHLLNQNSLTFDAHLIQHQQKQYHTASMINNNPHSLLSYCPTPSIQHQKQPYNHFHYINPYSQDTSNAYHSDHQVYFSNPSQHAYSSYDSNNNYSDYQQQYGLLRPVIEPEHYSSSYYCQSSMNNEHTKTNENLIHNLNNNNTNLIHYPDPNSMTNGHMEKHYDYVNNVHHGLHDEKQDDHASLLPTSNENNFHWNQTACLTTQW
ncbi:unnamed protein product [Rotaria socialis]|uniref:HMG box domain-containing protein n=1 Tax=Rotaria socialis TaxID=392032 RepID=A0A820RY37_9BILA|nr:unnamed protein product [Rotaria socialis]